MTLAHPVDAVLDRLVQDPRVHFEVDLERASVHLQGLPDDEIDEVMRAIENVRRSLKLTLLAREWMRHEPDWRDRVTSWPEPVRDVVQERARYFEDKLGLPPDVAAWYGYAALTGWDRVERKGAA